MSAEAATLADITSADWSLKLGAIGEVVQGIQDVDQCIRIILTTPKGSDVLRPTFGVDIWRYIDYPMNSAVPGIVREVSTAIALWEPRVSIVAINAAPATANSGQAGAQLQVSVTWALRLASATPPTRTTTVTFPGGF
jgi:phage baseplate assembly protein W